MGPCAEAWADRMGHGGRGPWLPRGMALACALLAGAAFADDSPQDLVRSVPANVMALCAAQLSPGQETQWAPCTPAAEAPLSLVEDAPLIEDEIRSDPGPHPWIALGEVTAINVFVWTWDRYIAKKDWAYISPAVWKQNLRTGFVWDGDGFSTNQFAHPYHGGLYYTASRDNGLEYESAVALTFLGSLQWELFAENEPPSANDLINTTVGGVAMGEALYRLSSLVLDTEARGRQRFVRELTAGVLSPVRGLNRVLRGDVNYHGASPTEWWPDDIAGWASLGYLKLGDGKSLAWGEDQFFIQGTLRYGDMYRGPHHRPFDAFNARVQFTSRETSLVTNARLQGLLAKATLWNTEHDELRLGLFQQLSYTDTLAYEVGGQFLNAGFLHEHKFANRARLRTALLADGSLITGVSSEHNGSDESEGRDYDYGPGVGFQFHMAYLREDWEVLTLDADAEHVFVVDGSGGAHRVHQAQLQVDLPVYKQLGMGSQLNFFRRHSRFESFPAVTKDTWQLRLFLSLH
ncbi:DUF3943 domain-containing protein [Corallococcus interemptor]|uniref:DUF3943 domain-containing protein n=1 Tax=Corallococcus interemptor TaxID=2316720 RepID=A0A3A8Q844_9BACT|nr:DUF3943 domain-containing protein [Corallococcus interemptor]RKH62395.1 DUF3943 domain-containing protein [Corallococcus interemptor]